MSARLPEYDDSAECRSRTRWRRFWIGLLVLVFAWWLWPHVAALRLASAIYARDHVAVLERVDATALRRSLSRQLARASMASLPQHRQLGGLVAQAAGGVVAGAISAVVAERMTPGAIALLLTDGRLPAVGDEASIEARALPRVQGIGGALRLFWASGFVTPVRFAIETPSDRPDEAYRLVLGLDHDGWRLKEVELPPSIVQRLVDEVRERVERPAN